MSSLKYVLVGAISISLAYSQVLLKYIENSNPSQEVIKNWQKKLKDYKIPKINKSKYPLPFHVENTYNKEFYGDVCTKCHTAYPHSKEKSKYASFLNMHCGFFTCTVCHVKIGASNYEWVKIENKKIFPVSGGPDRYGTTYIKYGNEIVLSGQFDNARIGPVIKGDPLDIPYELVKDKIDNKDPKFVAKLHGFIVKNSIYSCKDCHLSPKPPINLKNLGFSQERIEDIRGKDPVIKALIEGKKIYFPKFIK